MAEENDNPRGATASNAQVETPWDRLKRNRAAVVSAVWLIFITMVAFLAPEFMPDEWKGGENPQLAAPSGENYFGTDLNGRDLFYRVAIGARISITVGILGAIFAMFIGVTYGMVAAYAGGRTDNIMMRGVDILYAIPRLMVVLILIAVLDDPLKDFIGRLFTQNSTFHGLDYHIAGGVLLVGVDIVWPKFLFDGFVELCKSALTPLHGWDPEKSQALLSAWTSSSKVIVLIFALGLIEWLTMARIVRGQVLALKNQQFVIAARSLGQSHTQIMLKHIVPNILGVGITYLTLTIPAVILDESFLSFLGLGVEDPLASWGSLLSAAKSVINPLESYWWLLLFPALAMSLTLLALNFLGDGLRDAFDPRSER